jgi:quinolinate synthase
MFCEDMKKISPVDVLWSLENMAGEVKVREEIRQPALKAVQRMIDLAASN